MSADGHNGSRHELPLRDHTERALEDYFRLLNGHAPADLYDFVIREVEDPLFRIVLKHVDGNQSHAAEILGINRATLRRKLRELGITSG
ncbi:MAG: Fis family transcriptional regulator [Gammaproteobacteria bacterium]|nr:Fis family transcriptional regulator [Gammaproteobacteria bacterium]